MRVFALLLLMQIGASACGQTEDLRKSIYFGGGSYDIDEGQAKDLVHWLDSIPSLLDKYQIQLISHTDPIGGKRYNEWLSKMRSNTVLQVILNMDIPENFVHIKDWGLEKPDYANDSHQGLRLNRRVDVILHPVVF